MSVCLDAFALMAWLQDEPGAQQIEEYLSQATESQEHKCFVSFINLGEVYYSLYRKQGSAAADSFWEDVMRSEVPLTPVEATRKRIMEASRLKGRHPIAFADAFAVQLAIETGAPLVTGDAEIAAPEQIEDGLRVIWLPSR